MGRNNDIINHDAYNVHAGRCPPALLRASVAMPSGAECRMADTRTRQGFISAGRSGGGRRTAHVCLKQRLGPGHGWVAWGGMHGGNVGSLLGWSSGTGFAQGEGHAPLAWSLSIMDEEGAWQTARGLGGVACIRSIFTGIRMYQALSGGIAGPAWRCRCCWPCWAALRDT